MEIKELFFGKSNTNTSSNENTIKDPTLGWVIAIFSIFTTFAFWGWLSSWLIERARERGMSTSTVYLLIFIVSLSVLASTFLFYWYFLRSRRDIPPDHNPPSITIKEKQ